MKEVFDVMKERQQYFGHFEEPLSTTGRHWSSRLHEYVRASEKHRAMRRRERELRKHSRRTR